MARRKVHKDNDYRWLVTGAVLLALPLIGSSAHAASCGGDIRELRMDVCVPRSLPSSIRLGSDGSASLIGEAGGRYGRFSSRVSTAAFTALACRFSKTGFKKLTPRYVNAHVYDAGTVWISAAGPRISKKVLVYAVPEPPAFHTAESLLEDVKAKTAWEYEGDYTVDSLIIQNGIKDIITVRDKRGVDLYGVRSKAGGRVYREGDHDDVEGQVVYQSISPKSVVVNVRGKLLSIDASASAAPCAAEWSQ